MCAYEYVCLCMFICARIYVCVCACEYVSILPLVSELLLLTYTCARVFPLWFERLHLKETHIMNGYLI